MWNCTNCQAENPDSARSCQSCGVTKNTASVNKNNSAPRQSTSYSSSGQINQSKQAPALRIDPYMSKNTSAGLLDTVSNIYLFLSIVMAVGGFIVVKNIMGEEDFNLMYGLIGAVVILAIYIVPGLLLKAVAAMWQNTQDTSNLLLYQITKANETEQADG